MSLQRVAEGGGSDEQCDARWEDWVRFRLIEMGSQARNTRELARLGSCGQDKHVTGYCHDLRRRLLLLRLLLLSRG